MVLQGLVLWCWIFGVVHAEGVKWQFVLEHILQLYCLWSIPTVAELTAPSTLHAVTVFLALF